MMTELTQVTEINQSSKFIFKKGGERREKRERKTKITETRDADYETFHAESWESIQQIILKCKVLDSIKFYYSDFEDIRNIPQIGELLWNIRTLELRNCRQLHLNGLKNLVGSTVELREFAFYYAADENYTNNDKPSLASNTIHNLLTRNVHLYSLTIWDDIHDYSTLRIERPLTSINIKARTIKAQFWNSLRQSSFTTLTRYISQRYQLELEGEPMIFTNLKELRLGNLNFIPKNWSFPNIQSLTLEFDSSVRETRHVPSSFMPWIYTSHPHLHVLDCDFYFNSESHFTTLCQCCPNLRLINVRIGYIVGVSTIEHISGLNKLEVLSISLRRVSHKQSGGNGKVEDRNLRDMVDNIPSIRVLVCHNHVGEATFDAFVERAEQNPDKTYFISFNHSGHRPPNLFTYNLYFRYFLLFPKEASMDDIFDNYDYNLWKRIPIPVTKSGPETELEPEPYL